ncbi:MAG TPA: hypothetical protein VLS94_04385 [Fusibacter sp.]|nr:hypothetical protein [Fusibacter sp.]
MYGDASDDVHTEFEHYDADLDRIDGCPECLRLHAPMEEDDYPDLIPSDHLLFQTTFLAPLKQDDFNIPEVDQSFSIYKVQFSYVQVPYNSDQDYYTKEEEGVISSKIGLIFLHGVSKHLHPELSYFGKLVPSPDLDPDYPNTLVLKLEEGSLLANLLLDNSGLIQGKKYPSVIHDIIKWNHLRCQAETALCKIAAVEEKQESNFHRRQKIAHEERRQLIEQNFWLRTQAKRKFVEEGKRMKDLAKVYKEKRIKETLLLEERQDIYKMLSTEWTNKSDSYHDFVAKNNAIKNIKYEQGEHFNHLYNEMMKETAQFTAYV